MLDRFQQSLARSLWWGVVAGRLGMQETIAEKSPGVSGHTHNPEAIVAQN